MSFLKHCLQLLGPLLRHEYIVSGQHIWQVELLRLPHVDCFDVTSSLLKVFVDFMWCEEQETVETVRFNDLCEVRSLWVVEVLAINEDHLIFEKSGRQQSLQSEQPQFLVNREGKAAGHGTMSNTTTLSLWSTSVTLAGRASPFLRDRFLA